MTRLALVKRSLACAAAAALALTGFAATAAQAKPVPVRHAITLDIHGTKCSVVPDPGHKFVLTRSECHGALPATYGDGDPANAASPSRYWYGQTGSGAWLKSLSSGAGNTFTWYWSSNCGGRVNSTNECPFDLPTVGDTNLNCNYGNDPLIYAVSDLSSYNMADVLTNDPADSEDVIQNESGSTGEVFAYDVSSGSGGCGGSDSTNLINVYDTNQSSTYDNVTPYMAATVSVNTTVHVGPPSICGGHGECEWDVP